MTVSVSNTNLNDSFNTWRLNTNFAATVLSNNAVTVSRAGSAERGGVAKGNGHIAGTFTANELRTVRLHSGNTSNEGNYIQIASNTAVNATSFSVTANAIFQGNVNIATSGANRLILGDISRVRVTGGSRGQFLRIEGSTDTPNFKSLSLRDVADLSTNSAPIILSAANASYTDNGDSPAIVFAANNGTDKVSIFLASNTTAITSSDLIIQLPDTTANATISITNSSNVEQVAIRADGSVFATSNVTATGFTTSSNILPIADDSVDIGSPNREFRNAYFDGTVTTDIITTGTAGSQGVGSSLIPVTDALGNLGSTTRKWGTVWADNTNGGAGVFSSVGVSGAFTANGVATFNGGFSLNGDVNIGDATSDTLTITAQVDSDFDPQIGSQRDMGTTSNRWHNVYANNVFANTLVTDNGLTVKGDLTVEGGTQLASGQTFSSPVGRFTNAHVVTLFESNGITKLGNSPTDRIQIKGQVNSSIVPLNDGLYNLGSSTKQWGNLYVNGVATIDTLTIDVDSTLGGDRATVSGNVHIGDTVILTNGIKDGATTIVGKNGALHANNTITAKTITTTMIANTMATGGNFGSATQVPIFQVNDRGQITGISETNVAAVSGLTYTASNNNIRISTADGSTFDDTIDDATNAIKGVASFDSGDFNVASGAVSLKDSATGAVTTINGTANEVDVARTNGTVTVGLPTDVTVAGQLNVGENIVVQGNLVVQGTTTTVNSETVNIADNIIVLNSNESGVPSQNGGFAIERGTSINYSFLFDESTDRWTVGDRNLVANTFIGNVVGDVTGNVTGSANTLTNARTINLSLQGDVTGSGSVTFDGSSNVTLTAATTAIQPNSIVLGTDTVGNYMIDVAAGTGLDVSHTPGEGSTATLSIETDLRDGITHVGLSGTNYAEFNSNNYIEFITNSVERLRVDTSGIDVSGRVIADGDVTAHSDKRIKKDVVIIEDALEKVMQINGVNFTRTTDETRSSGVIAQEVEAVLPEVVHTAENGMKAVAYGNMVGLLIESIKELKAEIDELKKNK